jgi:hypothetical protein
MSRKRDPRYDPRAPETFFNPRFVRKLEAFPKPKQDQNPFQGFQNHIHTVFPKQQHNRPPYNGPNIFNSNIISDFSSFPIGNPKQLQHNNPPAFPKSQRSIYGSKNPFSGPTIQGPDIWKQLQQNNLPKPPIHEHVFDQNRFSDFSSFPKKF